MCLLANRLTPGLGFTETGNTLREEIGVTRMGVEPVEDVATGNSDWRLVVGRLWLASLMAHAPSKSMLLIGVLVVGARLTESSAGGDTKVADTARCAWTLEGTGSASRGRGALRTRGTVNMFLGSTSWQGAMMFGSEMEKWETNGVSPTMASVGAK